MKDLQYLKSEPRLIPIYLRFYIIDYPVILFHESCHYILAILFYIIDPYISFGDYPKMFITRAPKATICIDDSYSDDQNKEYNMIQGLSAAVSFTSSRTNFGRFYCMLIASGPAIGTILLILFTPWYLYPFYLSNISGFWLSLGDMRDITEYFNGTKRRIDLNKDICLEKENT